MITEVERKSGHTALALWIPLNLLRIFSESESQIKWLNKGVPRVIITKPILKSSWRVFVINGSFGQWLATIENHGHSIESNNECLYPKAPKSPFHRPRVLPSWKSSLYSVDLNIRECGNLTVLPHKLASKLASMYLYLCQCVCVRLCLFVPFMEETF